MKQFNKFATRELCPQPQGLGQNLVSLDSQNTNKYNDEHNLLHNLFPFIGHRFSHEGRDLVAIPLRNSTQKLFKILFLALLPLLLIACSGKVQTNKIPNAKNYTLPANSNFQEPKINVHLVSSFEKEVQDFFKVTRNEEEKKNIYRIGLERGHFSE